MKKNGKVFRAPKNHCLFLVIKTFDRCQKEKTERKSSSHIRDGAHSSISPSACDFFPHFLIILSPFMQAALLAITLAIVKL